MGSLFRARVDRVGLLLDGGDEVDDVAADAGDIVLLAQRVGGAKTPGRVSARVGRVLLVGVRRRTVGCARFLWVDAVFRGVVRDRVLGRDSHRVGAGDGVLHRGHDGCVSSLGNFILGGARFGGVFVLCASGGWAGSVSGGLVGVIGDYTLASADVFDSSVQGFAEEPVDEWFRLRSRAFCVVVCVHLSRIWQLLLSQVADICWCVCVSG